MPAVIVPSEQVGTPFVSSVHPLVETNVTPDGSVSVTTTLSASDGPALLTVSSEERRVGKASRSGWSEYHNERSASSPIVVSSDTELLAVLESGVLEVTDALLVIVPVVDESTVTTIV